MDGCLRPFHHRRHAREDAFDIAARLQAEGRAPVVQKVVFHIASALDELLLALGRAPGLVHTAADQGRIDPRKLTADFLREGEILLPVPGIEPVIEDAPGAARFIAMRQVEVGVAIGPEIRPAALALAVRAAVLLVGAAAAENDVEKWVSWIGTFDSTTRLRVIYK